MILSKHSEFSIKWTSPTQKKHFFLSNLIHNKSNTFITFIAIPVRLKINVLNTIFTFGIY